jgi:pimeloyl-ACP methyl ester carboxylesterase
MPQSLVPRGIVVLGLLCLSVAAPVLSYADNGVPTTGTVHVNDIDIAYKCLGSGDPLVMIMGYGGSMDLWSPRLLQLLSASHRVYVFDNRGMGRSTSTDREYSVALFAEDTLGLMDALGIERAAVLGWSLGTEIAQELAIDHPNKVRKLVLISGTPGGKEKVAPNPKVMEQLGDSSGTALEKGLRLIGLLFPQGWLMSHPFLPSYFPIGASMNPPERTRRQLSAMTSWDGSYARLGQIQSPTLIITGDSDVVVPPENSVLLAGGIRDSWLVRIPGGGHGVIFQYPEQIASDISVFLKDTEY